MKFHREGTHYPEVRDFQPNDYRPSPVFASVLMALAVFWGVGCVVWLLHVIEDPAQYEQRQEMRT